MRMILAVVTLGMALGSEPTGYPHRLAFTVEETQGVARVGEPVRVSLPRGVDAGGAPRLWNVDAAREEPVQVDQRGALLIASVAARSVTRYRLHYGKPGAPPSSLLKAAGDDLAWTVDTSNYIIDLRKNPGTGRNGQINTIFVKDPGVLLTRARPTSTLHLSPNAAASQHWAGINRWDPPARHLLSQGTLSVRLEREGEMPNVPQLWVRTAYEFFAGSPQIEVQESIEAKTGAGVVLLRVCEWSFAPGRENPFSHIGWQDEQGRIGWQKKDGELALPPGLRWMAFYSESRRFVFAAVIQSMQTGPLAEPASRFGGDPHYFYRVLIAAPKGKMVTVPAGSVYSTRYRIVCYRPSDPANPLEEAAAFSRAAREALRVRVSK